MMPRLIAWIAALVVLAGLGGQPRYRAGAR